MTELCIKIKTTINSLFEHSPKVIYELLNKLFLIIYLCQYEIYYKKPMGCPLKICQISTLRYLYTHLLWLWLVHLIQESESVSWLFQLVQLSHPLFLRVQMLKIWANWSKYNETLWLKSSNQVARNLESTKNLKSQLFWNL